MNPNQQLLNQSTQVAQQAARLIGGNFQQGRYDARGRLTGGFTLGNSARANRTRKILGNDYHPTTTLQAENIGDTEPYPIIPQSTEPTTGNLAQTTNSSLANTQASTETATPPSEKEEASSYLKKILGNITGQADEIEKIKQEENINKKQERAKALQREVEQLDKDYLDETKRIKESFGGTTSGATAELSKAYDKYNDRRANASIAFNSANDDYTASQNIVNEKIQALKDQNAQSIQVYQLWKNAINDDLTESEQLQMASNLRLKEQQAATFEDAYASALQAGQENKAGVGYYNALDAAKATGNIGELLEVQGRYGYETVDQKYNRAQLSKINSEIAALNPTIGSVTNPNASEYVGIIQTVLGSTKMTKDQKASFIQSINSGTDPFTVIKNQAKGLMTGANQTKLESYETARDTLADIGDQLREFYDKGGKTNIISGNFEKVIAKLGEVTDPALVSLATQIQGNIQVYRNAISGTAYSEQEGRDITSIFPGINKSESLNTAILNGRSRLFDSVIDSMYRNALGSDYDVLKNLNNQVNIGQQGETNQAPVISNGVDLNSFWLGGQTQGITPQTTPQIPPQSSGTRRPYSPFVGLSQGYKPFSLSSFFR